MAEQVVHRRQIEVHLAGEFRLERLALQVNRHVAPEAQMVEQQINLEGLAADFQMVLLADEGEVCAQLQQELADVG